MPRFALNRWTLLVTANAVLLGVLGFFSVTSAQQAQPQLPFSNSVEQRGDMLKELREIKELIKEQNSILRTIAKPEKHETGRR